MYYCSNCGVVIFYNRPDNPNKETKAYIPLECKTCGSNKGYRKMLPEFLSALNMNEFDKFQNMVKEILEIEEE